MSNRTYVDLPNAWKPRDYQRPLWTSLKQGTKRAVAVWHRRAGKDSLGVHWASVAAVKRVGTYWHMLPTLRQGRLVVWDGITKDGKRVLDAWPSELIAKRRNDEMKLELVNGSIWQVVGSDNYNSLVGSNPVGVVFSEFSLADPAAWDFIRPILAENEGWALFLYTPRGRNHGAELFEMAETTQGWFAERLTVEHTHAISLTAVQEERMAGMSEEMIQQEFYCSFDAPLSGAYYAQQMMHAHEEDRVSGVPYDPSVRVETWWDLGIGDSTAVWFVQRVGKEFHLIDYHEASGESLAYYARILDEKDYLYSDHYVPHDANARELGTGKTRIETMESLGLKATLVPQHKVEDGIEAARNIIPMCWFDAKKCARGIEALKSYRKEYDESNKVFRTRPVHDWASHGADAFRYGAMTAPLITSTGYKPPRLRAGWMGS